MVATASDSLSPVPQVAIATAAAGNRSLPAPAQGGPTGGDGPDRLFLGLPDPYLSLVGLSQQFLRDLNGSADQTRIAKG